MIALSTVELLTYLESFAGRMSASPPYLRFLLRALYLPPEALKDRAEELGRRHYGELWRIIDKKLERLDVAPEAASDLSTAYIGIMDSVQTAVLYAPAFAQQRLECLWTLFTRALSTDPTDR